MEFHIKDLSLAERGLKLIEWAEMEMPVLKQIREKFKEKRPLKGVRIGGCLHITTETANLVKTLKEGGAEVFLCASNPLSTKDEVAAALVKYFEIPVFAIRGEDKETYYSHIKAVLSKEPHITIDDGADLVTTLHKERSYTLEKIWGGTEETTTGVIRLKAMARQGLLKYPIIAVNDALTKHLFDNRYGTGQSTIDGILRTTNRLLAGANFVIAGFGWCGKGLAMRARGMGAKVIITEVDPIKALEAVMEGYLVMSMNKAAEIGDFFCTVTGNKSVIRKEHFLKMKDGAIIANSGHFDIEIDIEDLKSISTQIRQIKEEVEEYTLVNGRRIYLLCQGRLVNLAGAEGHPSAVMDMSFANQALCIEYIVKNYHKLEKKVYPVPEEIDREVAKLKLKAMGIKIDSLTLEQEKYLTSWEEGT